ncbi:hypothetical protein IKW72_01880 [bacterium]|nr:hypothetical protein [bacterium]
MKKFFLFMTLVLGALGAFGEAAYFNFEAIGTGALNGKDGWSATDSVLVSETQVVDTTNSINVAAWFKYGKRSVEMAGESSLSRTVVFDSDNEQRIVFDFYATLPEDLSEKSVVVSLGDAPLLRLRQIGANAIVLEVYGSYFGDAPAWRELPGVQALFHRKWQHLELLLTHDRLLKIKTPYKDVELAGFALASDLGSGDLEFKVENGLSRFYLDNVKFREEAEKHSVILEENEEGEGASFSVDGGAAEEGLEVTFRTVSQGSQGALSVGPFTLEIKEGGGLFKGDERLAEVMGFGEENVFSLGFLKNGRLVKFGCNGEDNNFTDVYVSEGGLGSLTFEFSKTSGDTNSVFAVKGFFAQDSLPIVYGEVPCLDVLMTAYTGAGNNTPPANYTNIYYPQVKDFYYRNSNAQLLLLYDSVYRNIIPPAPDFFRNYTNEYGELELGGRIMARDLRRTLGIWNEEYDIFVFTYGNGWSHCGGNWGGGSAYYTGMGEIMCSQVGNWGGDGTTFVTVHEMMHSIDQMYHNSGHREYASSHPDGSIYGWATGGEDLSWCGNAMRPFTNYFGMKIPWNGRYYYRDSDCDGLGDDDFLLPNDEVRMNSNPAESDTDGDGLSDLNEYLAGLYFPSDATDPDTDGDGIEDGDDPYPIVGYNKKIPRLLVEPEFDGVIKEGEWNYWGRGTLCNKGVTNFHVTAYAGWREDGLYLAFETDQLCGITIELDGSAWSGPWFGGDTFRFKIFNQYANRLISTADDARGMGAWKSGLTPTGAKVKKALSGNGIIAEIKIPCNLGNIRGYTCWPEEEATNCFRCAVGASLGMLLTFDGIGQRRVSTEEYKLKPYAQAFERLDWHIFDLVENDETFALVSALPESEEFRLGETEKIDLKYVSYGEGGEAFVKLQSLGEVAYGSEGTAALAGGGSITETVLELAVPDEAAAAGDTEFLLTTQLGETVLSNRFNWRVVPEPGGLLTLLTLLLFTGIRRRMAQ